ncbi:MAG: hypothetical protein GYA24_16075 [Candidatus Lokiarchaeota archaeon]|nr:hypothetical protein [Candidatus Lokiarchaeota archaeon]
MIMITPLIYLDFIPDAHLLRIIVNGRTLDELIYSLEVVSPDYQGNFKPLKETFDDMGRLQGTLDRNDVEVIAKIFREWASNGFLKDDLNYYFAIPILSELLDDVTDDIIKKAIMSLIDSALRSSNSSFKKKIAECCYFLLRLDQISILLSDHNSGVKEVLLRKIACSSELMITVEQFAQMARDSATFRDEFGNEIPLRGLLGNLRNQISKYPENAFSSDFLDDIVNDEVDGLRQAIAYWPYLPHKYIKTLLMDGSYLVLDAIASHLSLNSDDMKSLAENLRVKMLAEWDRRKSQYPNLDLISTRLRNYNPYRRALKKLSNRPDLPVDLRNTLID